MEDSVKENAEIIKFAGKELKTASDITAVQEALFADLMAGRITPAEAKKIQREVTARIKVLGSALKTAEQAMKLNKLLGPKRSPSATPKERDTGHQKARQTLSSLTFRLTSHT
jgi:hypothetical protein